MQAQTGLLKFLCLECRQKSPRMVDRQFHWRCDHHGITICEDAGSWSAVFDETTPHPTPRWSARPPTSSCYEKGYPLQMVQELRGSHTILCRQCRYNPPVSILNRLEWRCLHRGTAVMETRKPRRFLVLNEKPEIDFTGPSCMLNYTGKQERVNLSVDDLKTRLLVDGC